MVVNESALVIVPFQLKPDFESEACSCVVWSGVCGSSQWSVLAFTRTHHADSESLAALDGALLSGSVLRHGICPPKPLSAEFARRESSSHASGTHPCVSRALSATAAVLHQAEWRVELLADLVAVDSASQVSPLPLDRSRGGSPEMGATAFDRSAILADADEILDPGLLLQAVVTNG